MTLPYGFAKATVTGAPTLKPSRTRAETQYHVHVALDVGGQRWDVAINVGTDNRTDLLQYKFVDDFKHDITAQLAAAPDGSNDLTDAGALPALDFQRSDVLAGTGAWRRSDVMDGSTDVEPVRSVMDLLRRARSDALTTYVFGRFYKEGDGIHDVHMNQGSTGSFVHRRGNDHNDHNDVWQDGGLLVAGSDGRWTAYLSAFQKQFVPTDALGNPVDGAQPIR